MSAGNHSRGIGASQKSRAAARSVQSRGGEPRPAGPMRTSIFELDLTIMNKIVTTALLILLTVAGEAACSSNPSPPAARGDNYEPLPEERCARLFALANRRTRESNRTGRRSNAVVDQLDALQKKGDASSEEICGVVRELTKLNKELVELHHETAELWESAQEACRGEDVATASDAYDESREAYAKNVMDRSRIEKAFGSRCP